jgi:hypothetical protein
MVLEDKERRYVTDLAISEGCALLRRQGQRNNARRQSHQELSSHAEKVRLHAPEGDPHESLDRRHSLGRVTRSGTLPWLIPIYGICLSNALIGTDRRSNKCPALTIVLSECFARVFADSPELSRGGTETRSTDGNKNPQILSGLARERRRVASGIPTCEMFRAPACHSGHTMSD